MGMESSPVSTGAGCVACLPLSSWPHLSVLFEELIAVGSDFMMMMMTKQNEMNITTASVATTDNQESSYPGR